MENRSKWFHFVCFLKASFDFSFVRFNHSNYIACRCLLSFRRDQGSDNGFDFRCIPMDITINIAKFMDYLLSYWRAYFILNHFYMINYIKAKYVGVMFRGIL